MNSWMRDYNPNLTSRYPSDVGEKRRSDKETANRSNLTNIKAFGKKLIASGFEIIPVDNNGKPCVLPCLDTETSSKPIDSWTLVSSPDSANLPMDVVGFGILCGYKENLFVLQLSKDVDGHQQSGVAWYNQIMAKNEQEENEYTKSGSIIPLGSMLAVKTPDDKIQIYYRYVESCICLRDKIEDVSAEIIKSGYVLAPGFQRSDGKKYDLLFGRTQPRIVVTNPPPMIVDNIILPNIFSREFGSTWDQSIVDSFIHYVCHRWLGDPDPRNNFMLNWLSLSIINTTIHYKDIVVIGDGNSGINAMISLLEGLYLSFDVGFVQGVNELININAMMGNKRVVVVSNITNNDISSWYLGGNNTVSRTAASLAQHTNKQAKCATRIIICSNDDHVRGLVVTPLYQLLAVNTSFVVSHQQLRTNAVTFADKSLSSHFHNYLYHYQGNHEILGIQLPCEITPSIGSVGDDNKAMFSSLFGSILEELRQGQLRLAIFNHEGEDVVASEDLYNYYHCWSTTRNITPLCQKAFLEDLGKITGGEGKRIRVMINGKSTQRMFRYIGRIFTGLKLI